MNIDWSLIGKRDNNCSSNETASNNLCFSCKKTNSKVPEVLTPLGNDIIHSRKLNTFGTFGNTYGSLVSDTFGEIPKHNITTTKTDNDNDNGELVGTYCYKNCMSLNGNTKCNAINIVYPGEISHPPTIRIPEKN
jgi:hypothetical protein